MSDRPETDRPETDRPDSTAAGTGDTTNLRPSMPAGSEPPAEMTVIDDRYVLERRLGGGGMGVVFVARDQLLERHRDQNPYVALKLIRETFRDNPEMRTLLQRECSRAQQLSHPNIIRVFYFGCEKARDLDYLTMELLHGESLEQFILDNPSGASWVRSSAIIEQLCSGLEFAHAKGIVHSDVKPSNLFLTDAALLKILDFGIAAPLRSADAPGRETLVSARRLGARSERYSSLEMHLGMDADPSDDVFSAACVIHEVLTGKHPYRDLSAPLAAEKGLAPDPVPALSRTQNRALRKALNFRRAERTATVSELRAGLLGSVRPQPSGYTRYLAAGGAAALAASALLLYINRNSAKVLPPTPARAAATTVPAALSASPETPTKPPPEPVAAPTGRPPRTVTAVLPVLRTAAAPVRTGDAGTSAAAASRKSSRDLRCESIQEHTQLGESLSDEDRAYSRENCR